MRSVFRSANRKLPFRQKAIEVAFVLDLLADRSTRERDAHTQHSILPAKGSLLIGRHRGGAFYYKGERTKANSGTMRGELGDARERELRSKYYKKKKKKTSQEEEFDGAIRPASRCNVIVV